MSTRRILWLLIGGLSAFVLFGSSALMLLMVSTGPVAPQLLVIDQQSRLRLVSLDGQERTLAMDASSERWRYPAPAPGGRDIAYISHNANGMALFKMNLRSGARTLLYQSVQNPPLYLSWSPDGRHIAFISNLSSGGLAMHLVPADGSQSSELIGTTPNSSYFAWHPNSTTLLLHNGGSSFQGGQIALYQAGSTQPRSILDNPGLFQTPAWSISGEHFYYVAQPRVNGTPSLSMVESILTRVDPDGRNPTELAREKQAMILFSRAPDRDQIAYTTVNVTDHAPNPNDFGPLKIVAANGQAATTISRHDDNVAAFFWSPNGQHLAYLTVSPLPNTTLMRYTWNVVGREGGTVRQLVSFMPSPAFASMLNFFDAYAMSFNLWSPDSQHLTYSSDDGVYVLDMQSGTTRRTADGVLGVWVGQRSAAIL